MAFRRSTIKLGLFSVAAVAAATVLTMAVRPVFGGNAPLTAFALAVILSAAYGGAPAGLLSTALSVGTTLLLFPDRIVLLFAPRSEMGLFVAFGVGASIIVEGLHRKNSALAEARSELQAANNKLLEHTGALSKANTELHRFAYALAHDLNAPLRGIATLTDVLVENDLENLDDKSKECVALILNKVDRMQEMIRGLLEYAAAVDQPDDLAATDCNRMVQRAIQDLDAEITASGGRVTFAPLPTIGLSESHFVRVFSNLIQNAVKYRDAGRPPEIHVSAQEQAEEWTFCVGDNGIGLDMKYAEDIFGMFQRLHSSGKYEGSGIGLALCKTVVERQGGKIWVESESGRGSKFFFTLPKSVRIPAEREPASKAASALAKKAGDGGL